MIQQAREGVQQACRPAARGRAGRPAEGQPAQPTTWSSFGSTVRRSPPAAVTSTVEPGIYIEGLAGVRIEDTVLVTKAGCERLTAYPKELQIVG